MKSLFGRSYRPNTAGILCMLSRRTPQRLTTSNSNSSETKRDSNNILTVAIVGRPNVGKSTLFNRLTRSKLAIVTEIPGTTRDRKEGRGNLAGLDFKIIDTGGLDDRGAVSDAIQTQVKSAMKSADVVLFMVDAKTGMTALDNHFANWLRKSMGLISAEERKRGANVIKRDVICLVNKTEGALESNRVLDTISEAITLGLGEPIPISSSHGDGIPDLAVAMMAVADKRGIVYSSDDSKTSRRRFGQQVGSAAAADNSPLLQDEMGPEIDVMDRVIQLAIMGRPNVGKSTLLNAFVDDERVITGPTPGLTRDAIHVEWEYNNRRFKLVDTAGLTRIRTNKTNLEPDRKQTSAYNKVGYENIVLPGIRAVHKGDEFMKPDEDPSQFSYQVSEMALVSALNALRFSQVVLLVVEGHQGQFTKVDLQLARKCLTEGRALVIAANKSDLLVDSGVSETDYQAGVQKHVDTYLREFGSAPVVACSAFEKKGVKNILDVVVHTHDAWSKRTSTYVMNLWLKELLVANPAPRVSGRALKLKYITQIKGRPPSFAIFANMQSIPGFYERYLRTKLQEDFNLKGVPIRIIIRKTKGAEVRKHLLKQGYKSRRGIGHNEGMGVGKMRRQRGGISTFLKKKRTLSRDKRRRRDTKNKVNDK